MKIFYTFFFFLFCTIQLTLAQSSLEQLNTYMQSVREGSYVPVPQSILNEKAQANELLTALVTYQNDSNAVIRTRAYNISKRIGQNHSVIAVRQAAISQQI